jgi:hypothetical protein
VGGGFSRGCRAGGGCGDRAGDGWWRHAEDRDQQGCRKKASSQKRTIPEAVAHSELPFKCSPGAEGIGPLPQASMTQTGWSACLKKASLFSTQAGVTKLQRVGKSWVVGGGSWSGFPDAGTQGVFIAPSLGTA